MKPRAFWFRGHAAWPAKQGVYTKGVAGCGFYIMIATDDIAFPMECTAPLHGTRLACPPGRQRRRRRRVCDCVRRLIQPRTPARPKILAALYFCSNSDTLEGSDSGGIAQLGERLDGIEKVRGSSPLASIGMKGRPRYEAPAFLFFPSGIHRPRPELPGFGSRFSGFSQIFLRNRGGRKTTDLSPTMGTGRMQLKPNWRISFKFHPNVDN